MDWRTVVFDWNRARAFLVTAEEGSFSAAARALGLAQPTVGRQVAALEEELDVALFERAGHGLVLTPTGLDLVEHARAMGEAAAHVSRVAAGRSTSIEGKVTLSASEAISAHVLPPLLAALRAQHPGVRVELVATNARSDLRRREADIALRNFRPVDPELVARKVADSDAWLYATPAYLASIGGVSTVADLSKATFIGFADVDQMLNGLVAMGLPLTRPQFQLYSDSHLVQWGLCKQGLGICVMMLEVGEHEPGVVRVLPEHIPIRFPTWLTAHREVQTARRIRVVFDSLADGLAKALG